MSDILPRPEPAHALTVAATKAREYAALGVAENTRRAYRSDWADFVAWCATTGVQAVPARPETVALYLAGRADALKPATLERRLVSIAMAHKTAGHESPTAAPEVRAVMSGIRRDKGIAPQQKAPLLIADLRTMVQRLPGNVQGIRDQAVLLLGFAGGFRRSTIIGLDVGDLEFNSEGVTVTVRRSKTDQVGAGRKVGVPLGRHESTCPVAALRRWMIAAGINHGPLFRRVSRGGKVGSERLTAQSVARIMKCAAARAGLDPKRYGAHSLRSGLATSAAANGATERSIMRQTGHRSVVVLRAYIRGGSLYLENAAATAGL